MIKESLKVIFASSVLSVIVLTAILVSNYLNYGTFIFK